jgi:hypothetical protein
MAVPNGTANHRRARAPDRLSNASATTTAREHSSRMPHPRSPERLRRQRLPAQTPAPLRPRVAHRAQSRRRCLAAIQNIAMATK